MNASTNGLMGAETVAGGDLRAGARARPRVLVINENESVPSDRRVWAISQTLVGAGWDVVVVCPQGDESERAGGERNRFELRDGVRIHRFPLRFASGGLPGYVREYGAALWKARRAVAGLSRDHRFDIVHVCSPPDFMFLAAAPALRGGARLVFDHHDLSPELFLTRFGGGHRLTHRLMLLTERAAMHMADTVLAMNESYRRIELARGRKSPDDVFVVRNGPDTRRFKPTAPDPALKRGKPLLLAYVGVMAPQDGVDHALRALAELASSRTDWHAILAGEGVARPELERLAAELGIGDLVEFTGWLDDAEITRLLSTADVCLSPEPKSPLNDFSTMVKLGEYLAMSRPIVAFDLTESRLAAGAAALYAVPNESSSFAARIDELLSDPERRSWMGLLGRRRVELSLSWERSEEQLLAAYDRTLGLGRRQRHRRDRRSSSLLRR